MDWDRKNDGSKKTQKCGDTGSPCSDKHVLGQGGGGCDKTAQKHITQCPVWNKMVFEVWVKAWGSWGRVCQAVVRCPRATLNGPPLREDKGQKEDGLPLRILMWTRLRAQAARGAPTLREEPRGRAHTGGCDGPESEFPVP